MGNFNALLYSTFGLGKVLNDITKGNNDTDGYRTGNLRRGRMGCLHRVGHSQR